MALSDVRHIFVYFTNKVGLLPIMSANSPERKYYFYPSFFSFIFLAPMGTEIPKRKWMALVLLVRRA